MRIQQEERMNERVKELKESFDYFVEYFDSNPIFSGPSVYFHKKAIDILRKDGFSTVLKSEQFFEYLYATLASWGLHRMGKTNTKLVDFDKFKESITSQEKIFLTLGDKRITKLNIDTPITNHLRELIKKLKIGKGQTKIVFNSKAIHHLLPDLMPPIDRQYTLLFFYDSTNPLHIEDCFSEIYPKFISIALEKKDSIRKKVRKDRKGFHTSETKVIDNAIVGYVLEKKLKGQKRKK